MNSRDKSRLKRFVPFLLLSAAAVLLVMYFGTVTSALKAVLGIFSPLVIGCVLAYILNIIMIKFEKIYFPRSEKRAVLATRRPVCLILSLLAVILALTLIMVIIVPEIGNIFRVLSDSFPVYAATVQQWLAEAQEKFPAAAELIKENIDPSSLDWKTISQAVIDFAKNGMGGALTSALTVISSFFGGIVNFVVGLIFAIYILLSKEKLAEQTGKLMKSYMKPENESRFRYFCATADKCFSSFIVGQCTEAVILGLLCALGMTILRIPYASTIGTLIGATALIPIVGAYLGAAIGALMIVVVDPIKALWFLIFLVILQQVEGNVIYPKVVGSSIGLPGMWVLAAVTVGGGLGGIGGMLLGVPMAATVYKLLENDVHRRLDGENAAENLEEIPENTPEPPAEENAPVSREITENDGENGGSENSRDV
ncbi:MAG: AI-2E family transporter [Oscillospiraceae bacterium]|nr:AI-2E family transporter [Oscillospiraceae bacterium]